MKVCQRCQQPKPLERFGARPSASDGLKGTCKDCANAHSRAWKREHKDEHKATNERWGAANKERVRAAAAAWREKNRDKMRDLVRRWQQEFPEKVRAKTQRSRWKYQGLDMTPERYKVVLTEQAGVCAICKRPDTRALAVDHSHQTGKVRGLLCGNCNRGLGMFADDPARLAGAISYLARQQEP